jgi:membrane-associated phospholipid phosphatase
MNPWLDWGIPIIAWLQALGLWLKSPMEFFTFLGTEEFYLVVMPAILWCWDAGLGIRLGLILLTSDGLNGALKLAFGWPRPYWVSGQVRALASETSFGLPSGHAQNAVALWGRLAAGMRKRWAIWVAIALIFLISVSRLYLGVHFPADVLGGWIAGALVLWAFLRLEAPISRRLGRMGPGARVALAFAASLALLLVQFLVISLTRDRAIPPEWAERALAATGEAIAPRSLAGMFATSGLLFGFGSGAGLLAAWGRFDAQGPWLKRLARFLIGLVGVLAIWLGLRIVFPGGEEPLALGLRYLRYAAAGFWVAYLGPRAFAWLRLA